MKFSTKAIHIGQEPDKETGAVVPPIYLTSTYQQDAPAVLRAGYDYTRSGNPNFTNLERTLAALEGGAHATGHHDVEVAIGVDVRRVPVDRST